MPKLDRLSPRDGSDYVASVSSMVQYYCTCENCLGMPPVTIAGRNALEELKYIVAEIERDIANVDITLVTSLLGVYDAAHRIARGRKAPQEFVDRHCERVYQAWLKGDKRITDTEIFQIIGRLMMRNPASVPDNRSQWYFDKMIDWCRQIREFGRFECTSRAEARMRAAIFVNTDLMAVDRDMLKRRCAAHYQPIAIS